MLPAITDLCTTGLVDGIDLAINIETLRFFDGNVAAVQFGMSVTGTSGIDNLKG